MNPQQKVILITGAANGIGRETARLFVDKGWFVMALDIDSNSLQSLQHDLGADNCAIETVDVTDHTAYRNSLVRIATSTGRMDILFNNAGILRTGPLSDMPYEDILQQINTNFVAVVTGIYAALPWLKSTPNSLCFSMSSSTAIFGIPYASIYCATKHAVKGLTESLSQELEEFDVRVADTLPGVIDTKMIEGPIKDSSAEQGMWRLLPASYIAEVVWKAYHSNRLHWYVPEELEGYERDVLDRLDQFNIANQS